LLIVEKVGLDADDSKNQVLHNIRLTELISAVELSYLTKQEHYLPFTGRRSGHPDLSKPP
jgi:hypothetical protein